MFSSISFVYFIKLDFSWQNRFSGLVLQVLQWDQLNAQSMKIQRWFLNSLKLKHSSPHWVLSLQVLRCLLMVTKRAKFSLRVWNALTRGIFLTETWDPRFKITSCRPRGVDVPTGRLETFGFSSHHYRLQKLVAGFHRCVHYFSFLRNIFCFYVEFDGWIIYVALSRVTNMSKNTD